MTDDIERLLRLAAGPTDVPLDLPALAGRAARQRRHRAVAVGAIGLAVLAAAGGVATARTTPRPHGLTVVTPPSPTPTPTPTSPSPSATPTPAPTPPSASPTPTPSPPPAHLTASARGADGLSATGTLTPGGTATARQASLALHATDDDGEPYLGSVDWGDGWVDRGQPSPGVMCEGSPSPGTKTPRQYDEVLPHAWRHPGRYTVRVAITSRGPCHFATPAEDASFSFTVDVTAGETASNGPGVPAARYFFLDLEGGQPTASFEVRDTDGYVATVRIDWGDGSPRTVLRNDVGCDDDRGARFPGNAPFHITTATHDYPARGKWTATLTFTSAGCDGRDVQLPAQAVTADFALPQSPP